MDALQGGSQKNYVGRQSQLQLCRIGTPTITIFSSCAAPQFEISQHITLAIQHAELNERLVVGESEKIR